MKYMLAIDQSTSATKVLLINEVGEVVSRESRIHKQYYPQPGWVEHDAEEIWQNLLSAADDVVKNNMHLADHFAGVSITNQRETVVVFSRETGEPLNRAIVWQCRRSEALCDLHIDNGFSPWVHQRTGLRIDPYFSASKIQWLLQNRPDLQRLVEEGKALIGTMDTYLMYRLTQCRTHSTDSTNASRTLLFNIKTLKWDEELCQLWGVPQKALPMVQSSNQHFGVTALEGVLPKALPIIGVMGDSQASLFAQRCFDSGMAKATFGTGSSVLLNIGSSLTFSKCGLVTALAWEYNGKPTYALEGIIIHSAATLEWMVNQLNIADDVADLEAMARELDDSGGVYVVPAFAGLGFPYWDAMARGAIVGLSGYSDQRHIARAGLESIAYQLRDTLDAMEDESAIPVLDLKVDGGPTANTLLMQFTSDLTRTKLEVSQARDCSALGAALMGLLGLGVYKNLQALAQLPMKNTVYQPVMTEATAMQLYNGWRGAVSQVLKGSKNPLGKILADVEENSTPAGSIV